MLLGALSNIGNKQGTLPIGNTLMAYAENAKNKRMTSTELEKARNLIGNAPRHYIGMYFQISSIELTSDRQ